MNGLQQHPLQRPMLLHVASPARLNMSFIQHAPQPNSITKLVIRDDIREAYKGTPALYAYPAWDALWIIVTSLLDSEWSTDPTVLRNAVLSGSDNYIGMSNFMDWMQTATGNTATMPFLNFHRAQAPILGPFCNLPLPSGPLSDAKNNVPLGGKLCHTE